MNSKNVPGFGLRLHEPMAVFSTAFELRGADLPFFMQEKHFLKEKKNFLEKLFCLKKVMLLKFNGL
jgi:hypothetical protein